LESPISLQREYDNIADRNAVRLLSGTAELGYVPRAVAQLIAPEMDTGRIFTSVIREITSDDVPNITIEIGRVT
ncbi:MAG TPA: HIRAN domain-containing protein, partial [Candidatus Limnocylindrales bacterium]